MAAPARIVGLNVGGQVFLTTLTTLQSRGPNFVSTMVENDLSGRHVLTSQWVGLSRCGTLHLRTSVPTHTSHAGNAWIVC